MIIIESRTKGIKFERHKEESLISSQFLKNQKKAKPHIFWFLFNKSLLQWVHATYKAWLKIENMKNVLNNKTLNNSWFCLKLAYPK